MQKEGLRTPSCIAPRAAMHRSPFLFAAAAIGGTRPESSRVLCATYELTQFGDDISDPIGSRSRPTPREM